MTSLPTEDDIARARSDLTFRKQLLAQALERLLAALNLMRKNNEKDPVSVRQIKEGVDLAVQLSDKLHQLDGRRGSRVA